MIRHSVANLALATLSLVFVSACKPDEDSKNEDRRQAFMCDQTESDFLKAHGPKQKFAVIPQLDVTMYTTLGITMPTIESMQPKPVPNDREKAALLARRAEVCLSQ